ncbi:MAG TPA: endonuclease/exonuclease/phosphatase family protein [Archangium sp.]
MARGPWGWNVRAYRIGIGAALVGTFSCAPVDLRVVAFNAASGAGYTSPEARERQRDFLAAQQADVVFVVEVDRFTQRNGGEDTLKQIWPEATGVFGRATILDVQTSTSRTGEYGVGILFAPGVLDRVEEARVVPLPSHLDEEPRVALVVDAWVRGAPVRLVCTHFSVYGPEPKSIRTMQASAVLDLRRRDRPVIIGGDFNGALEEVNLGPAATSDVMGVIVWGANARGGVSVPAPKGVTDHEGAAVLTVRLP